MKNMFDFPEYKEIRTKIYQEYDSVVSLDELDDRRSSALLLDDLLKELFKVAQKAKLKETPELDEIAQLLKQDLSRQEYEKLLNRSYRVLRAIDAQIIRFLKGKSFKIRSLKNFKKMVFGILILMGSSVIATKGTIALMTRGHGLRGDYFLGTNFDEFYRSRRDKTINFTWKYLNPFFGFPGDEFSIRWTGFLTTDEAGTYEFMTNSDDGVRLWIDGNRIIDDWTTHWEKSNIARVDLSAGQHPIKLEFFEKHKVASIALFWKPPGSLAPQIIPSKVLRINAPDDAGVQSAN